MNLSMHLDLLQRWERGLLLRKALQEIVRSDSKVLDAGCGSGILSLWAAQLGAAEVVGVDVGDMAGAQALAKSNGLTSKVRFIRGDINNVDVGGVEKRFDIVLGMLYFSDPRRDEGVAKLTQSLHQRFLVKSGTYVPSRVEYSAFACDWPSQDISSRRKTMRDALPNLEKHYGLSFDALTDLAFRRGSSPLVSEAPHLRPP